MNIDDKKNLLLSLLVTLIVSTILTQADIFKRGQYLVDDYVQKHLGHTADYSDILIIDIDEVSIQALHSQLGSWPYDRYVFSSLLSFLEESGADQIVFDILFSDLRKGDKEFSGKLMKTKKSHLAAILLHDYFLDNKTNEALLEQKYWDVTNPPEIRAKGALFPNKNLLQQANIGLISVIPSVDGIIRDIPLIYNINQHYLPSMALSVVSRHNKSVAFDWENLLASSGLYSWPVTPKGEITLKFSRNLRELPVIPFYKVLLTAFGDNKNGVSKDLFANKTIFLGSTATVIGDYTYIPNEGRIYGLGLLAHIYHSLKHGHVLNSNSIIANTIITLPWILILSGIIFIWGIKPIALYIGVILSGILTAGILAIFYSAVNIQAWYLLPAFSALLFVITTTLIKTITLQLDKSRINLERQAEKETQELREKYLVYHDLLTELPNRTYFTERSDTFISEDGINNEFAIILIDLDRFKTINDTLGHDAGDDLLVELSWRLSEVTPESSLLARLGGDEFVILLEKTDKNIPYYDLVIDLLHTIAKPFSINNNSLHVTACIGISSYPSDGMDTSELLKNAEIAMYRAKQLGSNNYQHYSDDINQSNLQRLTLENDLRVALDRDEFVLVYQPKVSIDTGMMTGVEALIRWQHPARGMISPVEFIPLLEETNLILEVGNWIISTACQQLKEWRSLGFIDISIAINVSGKQFNAKYFIEHLKTQVSQYELNPDNIELEITENILMENFASTLNSLNDLYESGFNIAIDDFGTGYSSLSYLRKLKINVLKIDKSFIDDIPENKDSQAIAAAIIAMSHSLGISTVAEGIETKQQLDFLKRHKCEIGQGYMFGKPMSSIEISEILKTGTPLFTYG